MTMKMRIREVVLSRGKIYNYGQFNEQQFTWNGDLEAHQGSIQGYSFLT